MVSSNSFKFPFYPWREVLHSSLTRNYSCQIVWKRVSKCYVAQGYLESALEVVMIIVSTLMQGEEISQTCFK